MHPSLVEIKITVKNPKELFFENLDKKFVEKVIKNLATSKEVCATK